MKKDIKDFSNVMPEPVEEVKEDNIDLNEEVEGSEPVEPLVEGEVVRKVNFMGNVTGCALLNVRKEPSVTADVVKQLKFGELVVIIGEEGDFYKIDDGYVMKKFIDKELTDKA